MADHPQVPRFSEALAAVGADLDRMTDFWTALRRTKDYPDAVLQMTGLLGSSLAMQAPGAAEEHLTRLLTVAVARLAGDQ